MRNKTIGIIGTRSRDKKSDFKEVEKEFLKIYKNGDMICSGLCPKGGDRFAVVLQEKYNTDKKWFPAEWEKFGRRAGFMRNADIAKCSDVLIACVNKDRTGGTEDTIEKFIKFKGSIENLIIV